MAKQHTLPQIDAAINAARASQEGYGDGMAGALPELLRAAESMRAQLYGSHQCLAAHAGELPDDVMQPAGAGLRTFEDAESLGAYSLARMWSDTMRLPVDIPAGDARKAGVPVRTVGHDLDEVAVTAALAWWLRHWLPIGMHRALLRGASIEEVAAAAGVEFNEATRMWREWSDGQRHIHREMPHLPDHTVDYDRVDELIRGAAHDRTLSRPVGNLRLR